MNWDEAPVVDSGAAPPAPGLTGDMVQSLENSAGYARTHNVPVNDVVSSAGAVGLNQVTPGTAKQYGFDPARLHEAAYNQQAADAIRADLNKRYNNDAEAAAIAYNAGPGRADHWLAAGRNDAVLPKETQKYVNHLRTLLGGGQEPAWQAAPMVTESSWQNAPVVPEPKAPAPQPDDDVSYGGAFVHGLARAGKGFVDTARWAAGLEPDTSVDPTGDKLAQPWNFIGNPISTTAKQALYGVGESVPFVASLGVTAGSGAPGAVPYLERLGQQIGLPGIMAKALPTIAAASGESALQGLGENVQQEHGDTLRGLERQGIESGFAGLGMLPFAYPFKTAMGTFAGLMGSQLASGVAQGIAEPALMGDKQKTIGELASELPSEAVSALGPAFMGALFHMPGKPVIGEEGAKTPTPEARRKELEIKTGQRAPDVVEEPPPVEAPPPAPSGAPRDRIEIKSEEDLEGGSARNNGNSAAQDQAGNGKYSHFDWPTGEGEKPIPFTITTPKDQFRQMPDGTHVQEPYSTGYLRETKGADDKPIGVTVAHGEAGGDKAYIVNVNNADGEFQGHHVMLGFKDGQAASDAFGQMSFGRDANIRSITPIDFGELAEILRESKDNPIHFPLEKNELPAPRPVAQPAQIFDWIRRIGGLKDDSGELQSRELHRTKGLVSKNGVDLDTAAQQAQEHGYVPRTFDDQGVVQRAVREDLLDAIDRQLAGEPVYSSFDQDRVDAYNKYLKDLAEYKRSTQGKVAPTSDEIPFSKSNFNPVSQARAKYTPRRRPEIGVGPTLAPFVRGGFSNFRDERGLHPESGHPATAANTALPEWFGHVKGMVTDLAKRFGIDHKIQFYAATERGSTAGATHPNGLIVVRDNLSPKAAVATALHELGHQIDYQKFRKAPQAVQNSVRAAYGKWASEMRSNPDAKTVRQFLPVSGEEMTGGDLRLSEIGQSNRDYLTNFQEFFAEQASRWLTTDAKPLNIVDRFFKGIADHWKRLYQLVIGHVPLTDEVRDFMNGAWRDEAVSETGASQASAPGAPSSPNAPGAAGANGSSAVPPPQPSAGGGGGGPPTPPGGATPPGGGGPFPPGQTPPIGPNPSRVPQNVRAMLTPIIGQKGADFVTDVARDIQMKAAPMAVGARTAGMQGLLNQWRAAAKDFMNAKRVIDWDAFQDLETLKRKYTDAQRRRMWVAADKESVAQQLGHAPLTAPDGLASLSPEERADVQAMQQKSEIVWNTMRTAGIVQGDFLPSYVPRIMYEMGQGGPYRASGATGSGSDWGGRGGNMSAAMRGRNWLTAEETRDAAQFKTQKNLQIIEDIRTLVLSRANAQNVLAIRAAVNELEQLGNRVGQTIVSHNVMPGREGEFFTIAHPAFYTTFAHTMMGTDGQAYTVWDKKPLYIHSDFRGPLEAMVSQRSNALYRALLDLKGKTMSVIMFSPLIHNMVIFGKALPSMPGKMLSLQAYRDGNSFWRNDNDVREAMWAGLTPIGHNGAFQDIDSILQQRPLETGRSLTAKVLGGIPGMFDKRAGDAVKGAIDRMGDFWHNTLLWDRIRDLQGGLYRNIRDDMIQKGHDRETATRMAATLANQYVGSLPMESMGHAARQWANFVFFSRSFTFSNLASMKTAIMGMPRDVQAQILRDAGQVALNRAQSTARAKAWMMLATDVGLYYAGNSLIQSGLATMGAAGTLSTLGGTLGGAILGGALAGGPGAAIGAIAGGGAGAAASQPWWSGNKTLEQEAQGYVDRLKHLALSNVDTPWNLVNPFWDLQELTTNSMNEPGREDKILAGRDADGTAIYARNPAGKVAEEFLDWSGLGGRGTGPLATFLRKQGTLIKPLGEIASNNSGFGHQIYDPNGTNVEALARIAAHFFGAQLPTQSLEGLGRVTGVSQALGISEQPTTSMDYFKTFGPLAGLTFSRGAPGGPQAGVRFLGDEQLKFRLQNALPGIRDEIRAGNVGDAMTQLRKLGVRPGYAQWVRRTTVNPRLYQNPRAMEQLRREIANDPQMQFLLQNVNQ